MKEWLKKLVEDERRNAPSCASLYSPEFHTQLNEDGIRETPHKDGISRLLAAMTQRDRKIAELERCSEDNSDSWRDEAVVLDAEVVKLDAEIARLREEMEQLRQDRASVITSLLEAVRGIVEVVWVFDPRESLTEGQYGADLVRVWGRITQERNEDLAQVRLERDAAVAALKQFVGVIVRRQEQLKTGSGVAIASILGIARELFHKYQMTGNEPKPPAWVEAAREVVKARLLKSNPSVWRAVNQLVNAAPESWRK